MPQRLVDPGFFMLRKNKWTTSNFQRLLIPLQNGTATFFTSDRVKLTIGFKEGCSAILEGYQKALKVGGCPFVLAEHEKTLERLGVEAFEAPDGFWEKLDHLPAVNHGLPLDPGGGPK